jgi:hypothetical protein
VIVDRIHLAADENDLACTDLDEAESFFERRADPRVESVRHLLSTVSELSA